MTTPAWAWEKSRYLGNWKATLAWPELARCWQRYGGDAMLIAAAPPPGQAARPIERLAFPRHADFDRARLVARREGPYPEQLAAVALLNTQGAATAERVLDAVHAYFLDHDYDAVAEEVWNDEGKANLARLNPSQWADGELEEPKEPWLR